ncbi:MAG: C_GCAxxG_C_C family protein [Lachnospiraceae bacterium]|nr:C_GCAxxG_C_C family protein [Lachnospiraceae bacterium]
MNRADRAEELFRMGYNCCQSVFGAFNDVAGMKLDEAMKVASPFGAGFGKLREVCGAVTGMCMIAGYMKGYNDPKNMDDKKRVYKLIQDMCNDFKEKQGSYICREMLNLKEGEDLPEPAVRDENYYKSRPCVRACRTAAEIVEKYLLDN